ncbi:kti12, chromatin associated [Actinomortierella ambigua]|nr:kti12, chromatin associated [Actinomortierella ambigua]
MGDSSNERHVTLQEDDAMTDTCVVERPPIVLLSQQLPSQSHQNDILQQLYHSYQTQTGHPTSGFVQDPSQEQLFHQLQQQQQQHQQAVSGVTVFYRHKRSLSAPLMLKGQAGMQQQQATAEQDPVTGADNDVDMDQDATQSADQDCHRDARRSPPTIVDQVTQEGQSTHVASSPSSSLIPQPTVDYSKIYASRETFWASLPRYHRHKIYASIGQSRPDHKDTALSGTHYSSSSKGAISKVAYPPSQNLPRSIRCFYKLTPSRQWTTVSNLSSFSSPSSSVTSLRPNANDLLSHPPWDAAMGIGRIVLRSSPSPSGVTKAAQRSRLPIHIRHYTSRTHRRPGICVRSPTMAQNETATRQESSSSPPPSPSPLSPSQPQSHHLLDRMEPAEQKQYKAHSDDLHPYQTTFDHGSSHVLHLAASAPAASSTVGTRDIGTMDRLAATSLRNRLWAHQRGGLLNVVGTGDGGDSGGGGSGSASTKSNVDRILAMPLITLSGLPSSGKSRRAAELKQFLEQKLQQQAQEDPAAAKQFRIHVISDESLKLDKHQAYNTAADEKKARGALMSAVERLLSKDDIVIADGLNYIKGFRYQLYCLARAIGTPHCVIFTVCPIDQARAWNKATQAYPEKIFEELVMRFEEPDANTRWDGPLFSILPEDPSLPMDHIWDAVILKKPPPPNLSTVVKVVQETNYLYEFDQTTQNVVQAILDAQKSGVPTTQIVAPLSSIPVRLPPTRTATLSELRRLRRQFTTINKMRTMLSMNRVAEAFVEYLNQNLNS